MQEMTTTEQADQALEGETAVLFKHNPTCPISARAQQEVQSFASSNPDARVHMVDVLGSREVSNHLAERTGITHQSPQVIVASGGRAVYDAAGFAITADKLAEKVRGAGA
jgi:bacillithiol system protein YtxJ